MGPTVVVAGAMANKAGNAGEAWVRLSWVRGLQRVGCDVWFVEEIDERHCTDSDGAPTTFAASRQRQWSADVLADFGLSDRSMLLSNSGGVDGVPLEHLLDVASGAVLVNISGHLRHTALMSAFRRRIYIDIDPGFTQFWDANDDLGSQLDEHDVLVTIGENIGLPGCGVPVGNRRWHHVRQPVVLDDWPVIPSDEGGGSDETDAVRRFTTIATWRGPFGPIHHNERVFGLKVHEFRKYLPIAKLVDAHFEAALSIDPDEASDLALLRESEWQLIDPVHVAGTPDRFRSYVRGSTAEFSVAQGMYVESGCGWFSDRTTRYLASGRPALVQDTGFTGHLPTGHGLVPFTTLDQARRGAATILDDYDAHCASARAVAETCFDSDLVVSGLLETCLP